MCIQRYKLGPCPQRVYSQVGEVERVCRKLDIRQVALLSDGRVEQSAEVQRSEEMALCRWPFPQSSGLTYAWHSL